MTRITTLGGTLALIAAVPLDAQELLTLDARTQAPPPREGTLRMGTGTGPEGSIAINNRWLTLDGRPWLPVMGEFHYSRFPADHWEEELLKMKAAGIDIVATYVIWNQHELSPGVLDWTGDRDLARFARLCSRHGLKLFVRPGPWAHAETRFGGIPDWVVARTRVRSDDPAYLAEVTRFWGAMARELSGLMWKDGGPVVGIQLENEYNLAGPGQGRGHIATLKVLARRLGLDVPLYTVTGWDRTVYPRGEVAPVNGGYADEPWSARLTRLPPKENYLFRFDSRVSGDLGAQTRGGRVGDAELDRDDTPFLGAEYGGGVPVMYRRRPLVTPLDIAAAVRTQVGSGVNLLGYYMFHGGANPLAGGRSLEETSASGGYNDVPAIGYDFQAPIGQYGEVNPVSGALRPLHYFLRGHGADLATMAVYRPAVEPAGTADLATLRWSVRARGDAGFLFVNNHVRQYAMAAHPAVRFAVDLPGGRVTLPARGVAIPDGASFVWPIGMAVGGARLAWATAQAVATIPGGAGTGDAGALHVFQATGAGAAEFAFDAATVIHLSVPARAVNGRLIAAIVPSLDRIVSVTARDGSVAHVLLVSEADARRLWVGRWLGAQRLVIADAAVFGDDDRLVLRQRGDPAFGWRMWPALGRSAAGVSVDRGRGLPRYSARVPAAASHAPIATPIRTAGEALPIVIGGPARAAMQPLPEAHRAAAAWAITVPPAALSGVSDAWLEIDYRGDIARLFDGDTMIDDAFWDGRRWRIGLKRFADRLGRPWTLTVLPLRVDAPIYLDEAVRTALPAAGQVAELRGIDLVPEYALTLTAAGLP